MRKEEEGQIFTCPMHPEETSSQAGLCSICGMKLVLSQEKKDKNHNNKHKGHTTNIFAKRFWVSLVLSIPVVAYSDIVQTLFGWHFGAFGRHL